MHEAILHAAPAQARIAQVRGNTLTAAKAFPSDGKTIELQEKAEHQDEKQWALVIDRSMKHSIPAGFAAVQECMNTVTNHGSPFMKGVTKLFGNLDAQMHGGGEDEAATTRTDTR